MKYSHFETLALVLGSGAIVASIFVTTTASPQSAEVVAQLLLIVVLAAALHWGRNGGFIAALVAIAIYVAMRIPLLESQGLSSDLVTMLGTRTVTYGLVGVVGGELASRIKYIFARLESDTLIDPHTGVYSARYAADAILSGVGQWERYQTEYSIVTIVLGQSVFAALRAARARHLIRQIAGYIRNDIRMVDDLAAGSFGTLYVLLPRTDTAGAAVVADRLGQAVRELTGTKDQMITTSVLSASADAQALKSLAEVLSPAAARMTAAPPITGDRRGAPDAV